MTRPSLIVKTVSWLLCLAALLGASQAVAAQACAQEREPNNDPAHAGPLTGCLSGTLEVADQDLIRFTVTPEERQVAFTFTLEGIPDALTRAELLHIVSGGSGSSPPVSLFSFQTPEGGTVATRPVFLEPGDYVLGVSSGGAVGRYQLAMTREEDVPQFGDTEPNDNQAAAKPAAPDFELSGDLAGSDDWYAWTPSATTAEFRWTITVRAPAGAPLDLRLADGSGSFLAQAEADTFGYATLHDLSLPPNAHFIRLSSRAGTALPYVLAVNRTRAPFATYEGEPNNAEGQAEEWTVENPVHGRLGTGGDQDRYRFAVDEAPTGQLWEFHLDTRSRFPRRLCLLSLDLGWSHCREGKGLVSLVDLGLPEGSYALTIAGSADADSYYALSWRPGSDSGQGAEAEPNDTYLVAAEMGTGNRVNGRFVGEEFDVYRLQVVGEPQLWRIQASGDGIAQLSYINPAGQWQQSALGTNQRILRLTNLFLLPGSHFFAVKGSTSAYRLAAIPLGPPPPGLEREPNDSPGQANRLSFDEPRVGILQERGDQDRYRFSLAASEHVILTIDPPDDGSVRTSLLWGSGTLGGESNPTPGVPFRYEGVLAPGDYEVLLAAPVLSDSPYTLLLTRGNPFAEIGDREPNDSPANAAPVPASLVITGTVGTFGDNDWYQLPLLPANARIEITSATNVTLALLDATGSPLRNTPTWDSAHRVLSGAIDSGTAQPLLLTVGGRTQYELRLVFPNGGPAPMTTALSQVSLDLDLGPASVAAYWTVGQALDGLLTISNSSAAPVELLLDGHTSHYRIGLAFAQTSVTVPARAQAAVPLTVSVAEDLRAGAFPVSVRARTPNGQQVVSVETIEAMPEAAPARMLRVWPVPAQLLGGINAASLALGATVTTPDSVLAAEQRELHDGVTTLQGGFRASAGALPIELTVQLAGASPVPVAGILLHPQTGSGPQDKLRDFELWLSADGSSYSLALAGALDAIPIEQAFVLPESVPARFARLRLVNNHGSSQGLVDLGEWKVVAAPGFDLNGPPNIADPQNGGYVVASSPQVFNPGDVAGILVADGRSYTLDLKPGESAEWVVGFHHDRSALITDITWVQASGAPSGSGSSSVEVWTSSDSSVGPWTRLGSWSVGSGSTDFSLGTPTWARFVRFVTQAPPPDAIQIQEQSSTATYRSILGEWGHYSRSAVFEWLHPPEPAPFSSRADANDRRQQATGLETGEQVNSDVAIGSDVDWYRIDVPEDKNAVVLSLSGDPTVKVHIFFEDADGGLLPVKTSQLSPASQVMTVTVEAPTTVYFRVEEPPRSVFFSWDNSASVSSYADTIYSALSTFIEGISPGREVVNLLPFGSEPLLRTWGTQPAEVQQALNDYDRSDASSNAEEALLVATNELAFRNGTKVIMVMTDADSPGYPLTAELWRALAAVQPRIFTLAINSNITFGGLPANQQDLMQSWASVNSGYYDSMRTQDDIDVAFERAAAWLRRPSGYSLTANVVAVAPPGPGTLRLLSSSTGEDAVASAALLGNTAVEIILDASGSMREQLGARARIDIAKDVLLELVNNVLPQGIPVALRVFGNREGNYSCRTDLELPLQPLEPGNVTSIIEGIQPQMNANTALAASLQLAAGDLAGDSRRKAIILLTDGQETCGGDPAEAIQALRESGFDVRVHIIGFAIDDPALKRAFEDWASLGGGGYFDAADAETLSEAMARALRVPYDVLDEEGNIVGSGFVDGDPVSLPAGRYRVRVLTEPEVIADDVLIGGDEAVVLRVRLAADDG